MLGRVLSPRLREFASLNLRAFSVRTLDALRGLFAGLLVLIRAGMVRKQQNQSSLSRCSECGCIGRWISV